MDAVGTLAQRPEGCGSARASYLIPACNVDTLQAKLAALNKRARRLNRPEIAVVKTFDHLAREVDQPQVPGFLMIGGRSVAEPSHKRVWLGPEAFEANKVSLMPGTPTGRTMPVFKFEIEGETPRYEGWAFVATLSPLALDDGTVENLVRNVPGESCPEAFRGRVGDCDHCKTNRRRNETFVVKHLENGIHKVVGRNCLKDFLGLHADPHALASYAELLVELAAFCGDAEDYEWGGGGYAPSCWDLEEFLAWTFSLIEKEGWLSRTAAYERQSGNATADRVLNALIPPRPSNRDWEKWRESVRPSDEHRAKAAAAVEWARELEPNDNDYLHNIRLIAKAGYADLKMAGFAASIASAYMREVERQLKVKRLAARPDSHHVGVLKRRMTLTVTVEKIIAVEGYYGTTGIHKMADEDGNELTWFASGAATWLKEGRRYVIRATPTEHGDYKGRPQTKVSRVAVVEELGEPALSEPCTRTLVFS